MLISLGFVLSMTTQVWAVNPAGYGQAGGNLTLKFHEFRQANAQKLKE